MFDPVTALLLLTLFAGVVMISCAFVGSETDEQRKAREEQELEQIRRMK